MENSNYIAEAFQKLSLVEDDFNISADVENANDLRSYIADDVDLPAEEKIIDVAAEDENDLQDTYVGKVILECSCCHTRIYKDISEVVIDDETNLANIEEVCPVCSTASGFNVLGKIEAFEDENKLPEEEKADEEPSADDIPEDALPDEVIKEALKSVKESFIKLHEADEQGAWYGPRTDYTVTIQKVKPGTKVHNKLENANYVTNENKCYVITGTVGEQWPVDAKKVQQKYICDLNKLESGKPVKAKINPEAVKNDKGYFTVCKQSMKVKTDWGDVLHAEPGDLLRADGPGEEPNRVIDPGVFKTTYQKLSEALAEDINEVTIKTNEGKAKVSTEDAGKVTVDLTNDDISLDGEGESIVPLTDEEETTIESNVNPDDEDLLADDEFNDLEAAEEPLEDAEEEKTKEEVEESLNEDVKDEVYKKLKNLVNKKSKNNKKLGESELTEGISPDELSSILDKVIKFNIKQQRRGRAPEDFAKLVLTHCAGSSSMKVVQNCAKENGLNFKSFTVSRYDEAEDILDDLKVTLNDKNVVVYLDEFDRWGHKIYEELMTLILYYSKCALVVIANSGKSPMGPDMESRFRVVDLSQSSKEPKEPLSKDGQDYVMAKLKKLGESELTEGNLADRVRANLARKIAELDGAEVNEDCSLEEDNDLKAKVRANLLRKLNLTDEPETFEENFNKLGTAYLKRVYENVNDFTISKVVNLKNKLVVEGVINFASGNKKDTKFVFENKNKSTNGIISYTGMNETFSNAKKAFNLRGKEVNNRFIPESMVYSYNTKVLNEDNSSKLFKVCGRVIVK